MWRIFSSIPRAVRQQFNSSVRHTGACLDEENKQKTTGKVDKVEAFKKCHAQQSNVAKLDADPGQEKNREWKKSRFKEDFWWAFSCNQSVLEALRWGAAVAAGINLTKPIFCHQSPLEEPKRQTIIKEIAIHIPKQQQVLACGESVLPFDSKVPKRTPSKHVGPSGDCAQTDKTLSAEAQTKKDITPQKEPDLLDVAVRQFHDLCDTYFGTSESIKAMSFVRNKNYSMAVHHWQKASNVGYTKASYNLGVCYEQGLGISKDLNKAEECYRTAAAKGHREAMFNLASVMLKKSQNSEPAYEWIEKAASKGLKKAQTELAIHYLETQGKPKNRAGEMLENSADHKNSREQYYLAICYENGWGVARNECKAAHLYSVAAKAGNRDAQYSLGTFYEHGLGGLPEDQEAAKELYREAVEKGHLKAKERLDKLLAFEALQQWNEIQELKTSPKRTTRNLPKSHKDTISRAKKSIPGSRGYEVQTSASSPSLTELLRQQLSELQIQTPATSVSIPQFYIGEKDVTLSKETSHSDTWGSAGDVMSLQNNGKQGEMSRSVDCLVCT